MASIRKLPLSHCLCTRYQGFHGPNRGNRPTLQTPETYDHAIYHRAGSDCCIHPRPLLARDLLRYQVKRGGEHPFCLKVSRHLEREYCRAVYYECTISSTGLYYCYQLCHGQAAKEARSPRIRSPSLLVDMYHRGREGPLFFHGFPRVPQLLSVLLRARRRLWSTRIGRKKTSPAPSKNTFRARSTTSENPRCLATRA